MLRDVLGAQLRRHREQQGRTLREVAADACMALGYLSEVERGKKEASSETLALVCRSLGVSLDQILLDCVRTLTGPQQERPELIPA